MSVLEVKWLYALASVALVSLVALVGILTMPVGEKQLKEVVFVLVSLAAGALFGDAFLHLLPEAFANSSDTLATSSLVLAGILAFFMLEKFLHWRHEHMPGQGGALHPLGTVNLVADGLHNLIDGILIGSSYLAGDTVGITTTIAVLLHEIPQEIGDFGILLHAGFSKRRALLLNFLSALLAVVGAAVALAIGAYVERFSSVMLPIAAGAFVYVAGSDLVPELQREHRPFRSLLQLIAMCAGIMLMLLLAWLE